jgi:hypothetical protein
MTSLILPTSDTAMMNLFLAHVSQIFADSFIVMQVDRAGWHHAKDLVVPENMRLIPQPHTAPNSIQSNISGNIFAKSTFPISPAPRLMW